MDICTAIKRGYFALVRFLIDLGEDVNVRDEDGRSSLILCALIEDQKWGLGIAQTLLEKSASVAIKDKYGLNALHYACMYQCEDLVNIYLGAVDFPLNVGDKMGHSALFYAVNSGSISVVRAMVDALTRFAEPVDKANKYGVTPLMQAYMNKRFDIADVLIDEGCADEDIRDNEGRSARELADEYRNIYNTEQELGVRKARSAINRAKSAPPRRLRKVVEEEENAKKEPVLPMQRSANRVIRLCKDCDLRNDPVYMFNLTPMDLFMGEPLHAQPKDKDKHRPYSACGSWRRDLRSLYKHLEVRHTESFREPSCVPRSTSPSTVTGTDLMDGHGLRIPGSDSRMERRGSALSSKGSMGSSKMKQVEKLVANPLIKNRRGSSQGRDGRRSRQQIPVVKEPQ